MDTLHTTAQIGFWMDDCGINNNISANLSQLNFALVSPWLQGLVFLKLLGTKVEKVSDKQNEMNNDQE